MVGREGWRSPAKAAHPRFGPLGGQFLPLVDQGGELLPLNEGGELLPLTSPGESRGSRASKRRWRRPERLRRRRSARRRAARASSRRRGECSCTRAHQRLFCPVGDRQKPWRAIRMGQVGCDKWGKKGCVKLAIEDEENAAGGQCELEEAAEQGLA